MVINSDSSVLSLAICIFPTAFTDAIVGTKAVANAIFSESGTAVNASTFPANIPYCIFALASVIKVFKPLTTVIASIFFVITDISELRDIGIDTDNIVFIISFILYAL